MAEAGAGRHLPVVGIPPCPGPLVSSGHFCAPSPGLSTRALGCVPPAPAWPCFARDEDKGYDTTAEQAPSGPAPGASSEGPLASLWWGSGGWGCIRLSSPPHPPAPGLLLTGLGHLVHEAVLPPHAATPDPPHACGGSPE